jgi:hypothetical protein
VVRGSYWGDITVGNMTSTSSQGMILAELDPTAALSPFWVRNFDTGPDFAPMDLAVDRCGDLLLTGWSSGVPDFGCGRQTTPGSMELLILRLSL